MKTEVVKQKSEPEPPLCNNTKHFELASKGFKACTDCRRKFQTRPPWKCGRHSVYKVRSAKRESWIVRKFQRVGITSSMSGQIRIVQLDADEREKILRLEQIRQEREARFHSLLAQFCESHFVRIPDSRVNTLAVTPEGNISVQV